MEYTIPNLIVALHHLEKVSDDTCFENYMTEKRQVDNEVRYYREPDESSTKEYTEAYNHAVEIAEKTLIDIAQPYGCHWKNIHEMRTNGCRYYPYAVRKDIKGWLEGGIRNTNMASPFYWKVLRFG